MKKIKKKKIIILIIIVTLIIVEIIAFKNSRANKTLEINVSLEDSEKVISNQAQVWSASSNGNGEYYIVLPEYIKSNRIKEYEIVQDANVNNKQSNNNELENNITNDNIINQTQNNELKNDLVNQDTSKENSNEPKIYKPNEKLYLLQENLENNSIALKIKFDKKESNGEVIYYRNIFKEISNRRIQIEGYMPLSSTVEVIEIKKRRNSRKP